jgi:hypothetical protein
MAISKLQINPASLVRALAATAFMLIFLSIASVVADQLAGHDSIIFHKLNKFLHVGFELNVPAFFSTVILTIASLVLAVIAVLKRRQRDRYVVEWCILSIGFFLMAFDELLSVHEKMIEPMQELLGGRNLGIFYFAWVIPMGIVVLILAVLFFRFWWNLPPQTRIHFLIAAAMFLGGAVGLELVEGQHGEIYGVETLTYIALVTAEESLEMLGVIVFIKALFSYISATFGALEFRLENSQSKAEVRALSNVEDHRATGKALKTA